MVGNAASFVSRTADLDQRRAPSEEKAALEKMRAEELTQRERLVLEKGISNAEFHYLGSAKILGGVGKGLAEAMAELKQLEPIK